MKPCSKCLKAKLESEFGRNKGASDGLTSWCRACRCEHRAARTPGEKAYNRRYLAAHPECSKKWQAQFPERRAAQVALNNAVRDGRVTKTPCMVCGCTKVEGHHADYSRQLDVVWLCKQHHAECHTITAMATAQPQMALV